MSRQRRREAGEVEVEASNLEAEAGGAGEAGVATWRAGVASQAGLTWISCRKRQRGKTRRLRRQRQ